MVDYVTVLIPKESLTGDQIEEAKQLLLSRQSELNAKLTGITFERNRILVAFQPVGVQVQIPLIVFAIIAILALAGISIVLYQLTTVGAGITQFLQTWGVPLLGFSALVFTAYLIAKG